MFAICHVSSISRITLPPFTGSLSAADISIKYLSGLGTGNLKVGRSVEQLWQAEWQINLESNPQTIVWSKLADTFCLLNRNSQFPAQQNVLSYKKLINDMESVKLSFLCLFSTTERWDPRQWILSRYATLIKKGLFNNYKQFFFYWDRCWHGTKGIVKQIGAECPWSM